MKKSVATANCETSGHCFCRSKMVAIDALSKKRVRYCCWCGKEKS